MENTKRISHKIVVPRDEIVDIELVTETGALLAKFRSYGPGKMNLSVWAYITHWLEVNKKREETGHVLHGNSHSVARNDDERDFKIPGELSDDEYSKLQGYYFGKFAKHDDDFAGAEAWIESLTVGEARKILLTIE